MRIQQITTNYSPAQTIHYTHKNQTINHVVKKDTVSFGNYNNLFSKITSHNFDIKQYDELEYLFNRLISTAISEGKCKASVAATLLKETDFMKYKLKKFSQAFKSGLISHDETIVERNGSPLITAYDNSINFCNPFGHRYQNAIQFGFKNNKVVVERQYDKVKFHPNHKPSSYQTFSTDYRNSHTTYYKDNGEEDTLKNFFGGFLE